MAWKITSSSWCVFEKGRGITRRDRQRRRSRDVFNAERDAQLSFEVRACALITAQPL